MSLGVTFHALGSARECEGMNPYTPKRAPTLGVVGVKTHWIEEFHISLESSWNVDV